MSQPTFQKASKQLAKAKIALTGPSGSGKTMSALWLAKGLGGKCAVIDTENNSASLYADKFDGWSYDVLPMNPPYTAQKYFYGIELALKEGYGIIICDSISHMWAGEGGLLQQKEALDSRGGNSYANWGSITKIHEKFKSLLLYSNVHFIATMRSKQDYILESNEKGKQTPKKVGMAPIQRDGMEYEFTVVFDIAMDHQFMVSKDRTGLFDCVVDTINEQTGKDIKAWLADEITFTPEPEPTPPAAPPKKEDPPTGKDLSNLLGPATRSESGRPNTHTVSKIVQQRGKKTVRNHAPTKTKEAPLPSSATTEIFDPGDYVIQFGQKMGIQGKKIRDITDTDLRYTIKWAQDQKAPLPKVVSDFLGYAVDYLAVVQSAPDPEPPAKSYERNEGEGTDGGDEKPRGL